MQYKRLGNSDLDVSRICLGTNNFGGQVTEQDSIEIIKKALDHGINIIDTADVYTNGLSEKVIGKAVKGRREDVILATKVGMRTGLSRKNIIRQIKQSLESLKTDFIDLYYLHRFDPNTPLYETLTTLNDLVSEGKLRYIACSNFDSVQISKTQTICDKHDLEKLVAVQPRYNLLQRDIEKDLIPYCAKEKLGVLTYSPLMGGFLTGKYKKEESPPRKSRGEYNKRYWERIKKLDKHSFLERFSSIAEEVGIPMHKLAIAWVMKNPTVTGPILGASNLIQVEDNCNLTEISDKVYSKLNDAVRAW